MRKIFYCFFVLFTLLSCNSSNEEVVEPITLKGEILGVKVGGRIENAIDTLELQGYTINYDEGSCMYMIKEGFYLGGSYFENLTLFVDKRKIDMLLVSSKKFSDEKSAIEFYSNLVDTLDVKYKSLQVESDSALICNSVKIKTYKDVDKELSVRINFSEAEEKQFFFDQEMIDEYCHDRWHVLLDYTFIKKESKGTSEDI